MNTPDSNNNDGQTKNQVEAHTDNYRCPKCKSNRIKITYPLIECLACGYNQKLIDFAISWDFHRHYCQEFGLPDRGPCEPPEYTLDELGERVNVLEERFAGLSREGLKKLGLKQLKDEVEQLRLGLRYTQRLIPRKPSRKKAHKKVVTTEV